MVAGLRAGHGGPRSPRDPSQPRGNLQARRGRGSGPRSLLWLVSSCHQYVGWAGNTAPGLRPPRLHPTASWKADPLYSYSYS